MNDIIKDIPNNVIEQLKKFRICDFCLGRLFISSDDFNTIQTTGKNIRNYFSLEKHLSPSCQLCDGIVEEIPEYEKMILHAINSYDFSSFVIGFHIDEEISKREETIISLFDTFIGHSLKNYMQKIIGLSLEKKLNKAVDFEKPEIMIIFNTLFNTVSLQIKSLYIYGRYNKFDRTIPQTKWFCRLCRGKGCRNCNYTGTLYQTSIEELIAKPILKATNGTDESFHGSGREDIDVKMLGNGRPFVLEIINPQKRKIDLKKIQNKFNKHEQIRVTNLRFSDKNEIKRIKQAKFRKVYHVKIEGKKPFKTENLNKVGLALRGKIIKQFTPTRVAKRRANKIRKRQIFTCEVLEVDETMAIFAIETESGTYIKELVTGDDGKTTPNISELIGQPCKVVTLDVMEIKGE